MLDERHAAACRMSSKGTPPNRAMDVDTALTSCALGRRASGGEEDLEIASTIHLEIVSLDALPRGLYEMMKSE